MTSFPGYPGGSGDRSRVPLPLTVAASLVAVEAVVMFALAVLELPGMTGEKLAMNASTGLFFLAYGGFLVHAAWQLYRLGSWARAPIVLAQLIQLLVGGSFWGGATTPVAVVTILVAVLVLAGIFHPASIAALAAAEQGPDQTTR